MASIRTIEVRIKVKCNYSILDALKIRLAGFNLPLFKKRKITIDELIAKK